MPPYGDWTTKALVRWASDLEQTVARWDACRQQKPGDPYYTGMYDQTRRELSKVRGHLEKRGIDVSVR